MLETGFIFALLTTLFWGIAPICVKLGIKNMQPISAFEIRSIGVIFCFLLYSLISGRILQYPKFLTENYKTTFFLFLDGFLGAFIGQMTYYMAQKHWDASKTVIVVSAFPVITLILAYLILNEPVSLKKSVGLALVVVGICLIK